MGSKTCFSAINRKWNDKITRFFGLTKIGTRRMFWDEVCEKWVTGGRVLGVGSCENVGKLGQKCQYECPRFLKLHVESCCHGYLTIVVLIDRLLFIYVLAQFWLFVLSFLKPELVVGSNSTRIGDGWTRNMFIYQSFLDSKFSKLGVGFTLDLP